VGLRLLFGIEAPPGKAANRRSSPMPLTKRQREILKYLQGYTEENGYAPSFEEIARHFNYNSLATVHEHLTNLERKGYIKRSYNESRAIEILPSDVFPRAIDLPLYGTVAAGLPIEAVAGSETISVPEEFARQRGEHYVLKVRGNSMIDEQIRDGDFVIVNERKSADNGEMVIALLNGTAATVKRVYRERDGRIRLQPANESLAPMYVHENDILIQGVVVGVIRRY
jgi:repressor LexA